MIANDPLLQAFLEQNTTANAATTQQQSQPLPHDILLDQFDFLPLLPVTAPASSVSVGLGTPPMSPPVRSFSQPYKQFDQQQQWMDSHQTNSTVSYPEGMALFHQQQQSLPQQQSFTSHINTSSAPSKLLTHLYQQHHSQHQYQQQQQQQQQQMADSVFGTSPTSSYSSSPVSTVDADFELYPMSNAGASSALLIPSYSNDSTSTTTTTTATSTVAASYGQMTPPTPVMNDMVGLAAAAAAVSANNVAPVSTADMSMLCHCPGVYPCIPKSTKPLSPFVSAFEPEDDIIYEDQQQQNLDSQNGQDESRERYQVYNGNSGYQHQHHHHHHHISTSPYASPYSTEPTSPTTPTSSSSSSSLSSGGAKPLRTDRRRSSSYASSTSGGKAERTQHPLLDPSEVPEITDIHVCPVCQRRFTRPFNLRSHLMTHTTARPYPCDQCHWKFTRQHDLQRHKRAKHPNSVTPAPMPVNAGVGSLEAA